MSGLVLVTGGAGFIGRHVIAELHRAGYDVRAYDSLDPQVHGVPITPVDVGAELRVADVRDPYRLRAALSGVDAVVHLAAAVGVGQSMYEPYDYVSTNVLGTAVLLESLLAMSKRPRKLVVASSMSIYGEGGSGYVHESQAPDPRSVYALTKYDQEKLCLLLGGAYGISTVALRFFNVYGPGQALANPYTGVMALFGAQLLNGHRPLVYEDGKQTRDFVHVDDVARAVVAALNSPFVDGEAINVGSGIALEVSELALGLSSAMGLTIKPKITGETRIGDVRHCVADRRKAASKMDWTPKVRLIEGLRRQAEWLEGQHAPNNVDRAHAELKSHKLVR